LRGCPEKVSLSDTDVLKKLRRTLRCMRAYAVLLLCERVMK
jgi:hypothetical protein